MISLKDERSKFQNLKEPRACWHYSQCDQNLQVCLHMFPAEALMSEALRPDASRPRALRLKALRPEAL